MRRLALSVAIFTVLLLGFTPVQADTTATQQKPVSDQTIMSLAQGFVQDTAPEGVTVIDIEDRAVRFADVASGTVSRIGHYERAIGVEVTISERSDTEATVTGIVQNHSGVEPIAFATSDYTIPATVILFYDHTEQTAIYNWLNS